MFPIARASLARLGNDLDTAEKELRQACALEPKSLKAHLRLAEVLAIRGELPKAGEELKTAVDLAPLRSVARIKYAEYLNATGEAAAAHEMLSNITRARAGLCAGVDDAGAHRFASERNLITR